MCLFLPANVCMCTTLQMQKVPPSPSSFPPKHTHTCAGAHAIHRKCLSVCLSLCRSPPGEQFEEKRGKSLSGLERPTGGSVFIARFAIHLGQPGEEGRGRLEGDTLALLLGRVLALFPLHECVLRDEVAVVEAVEQRY